MNWNRSLESAKGYYACMFELTFPSTTWHHSVLLGGWKVIMTVGIDQSTGHRLQQACKRRIDIVFNAATCGCMGNIVDSNICLLASLLGSSKQDCQADWATLSAQGLSPKAMCWTRLVIWACMTMGLWIATTIPGCVPQTIAYPSQSLYFLIWSLHNEQIRL